MMNEKIIAKSAEEAFHKILNAINKEGIESNPRGFKIKEIINANIVILNPRDRIISCKERRFSAPYAFGELAWYLSGCNKLENICYYSKFQEKCSDDGETLNSAYGARIFGIHENDKLKMFYPKIEFNQWDECVKKLKNDRDTRQAIIHLHTPNDKKTKDEVCTLTLQFFVRNGKLDMITNMRSNDIVLGFTYDVFAFTFMQELLANELNVELGTYYHNVGSMHIYSKEFYNSKYDFLKEHTFNEVPAMQKINFTLKSEEIKKFIKIEKEIRFGKEIEIEFLESEFEALYFGAFLTKYYSNKKEFKKQNEICQKIRDFGFETASDVISIYCKNEMMNEKIIIEGPDGAGKTSFIKKHFYDKEVIHFVKPSTIFDFYKNYKFHLLNGRNEVFDRFFVSELIYSKNPRLSKECENELLCLLRECKYKFIFILSTNEEQSEILKSRLEENNDLNLEYKIFEINKKYFKYANYLIELGFEVEMYDIFGNKIN